MRGTTHLTLDAQKAFTLATTEAQNRHNILVANEHLLLGLLQLDSEPLNSVWSLLTTSREVFMAQITAELGMVRDEPLKEVKGLAAEVQSALTEALIISKEMRFNFVNSGHLLLGVMRSSSDSLRALLTDNGLQINAVAQTVTAHSPTTAETTQHLPIAEAKKKQPKPQQTAQENPVSPMWLYVSAGVLTVFGYLAVTDPPTLVSFGMVLGIWLFSLTLHEFSHAIVAYWGGDYTVREKGYLTFNPLRYTHPLLSIFLPILFLLLGGIALPGGAVYIRTDLLRSRGWRTAVSLAGPLSNVVVTLVISAPFWLGLIEFSAFDVPRWQSALAFSVFLQVFSIFINMLPIPPLDGFGALSPWLPRDVVQFARSIGFLGLILVYYLLQSSAFSVPLIEQVRDILDFINVPLEYVAEGFDYFMFWESE